MSQLKIKDGNSWIGIPAGGIGVPSGGSSGQVLKKSSSTDYATEWADDVFAPDMQNAEVLTALRTQGGTYTTPEKGFIVAFCVKDNDNAQSQFKLTVNNTPILIYQVESATKIQTTFYIPVPKGVTITADAVSNMYWVGSFNYGPYFAEAI